MPKTPCLNCGQLTTNPSRCETCRLAYQRTSRAGRPSATGRGLGAPHQVLRAEILAEHIAAHGYICPGWRREPHEADKLTADHIIPRAQGGRTERGNMQVLCLSCNSAKGARRN